MNDVSRPAGRGLCARFSLAADRPSHFFDSLPRALRAVRAPRSRLSGPKPCTPSACSRQHTSIRELLSLGTPGSDVGLLAADAWLADALLDCLDNSSTHVLNFLSSTIALASEEKIQSTATERRDGRKGERRATTVGRGA